MNKPIYSRPIFFEVNRVFRVYKGGKLLGELMGTEPEDTFYPEEWIASSVRANNPGSTDPKEGISKVEGTDIFLDDLIAEHPREMLGDKREIGVLVKYLDSAIRLPAQAHPDKSFSRKHFNSEHGKEECWIVLGTREGASICFDFKSGVDRESFSRAIDASADDRDAMERLLVRHEVEAGDVVLVPAKCPHAIGAGCLILEVQEPTDFTIQPEHYCADYELTEEEMYIGLGKETAIECFDFSGGHTVKRVPRVLSNEDGVKLEAIITAESENFSIYRTTLTDGEYALAIPVSVCVITEGEGVIEGDGYERRVKKGDYFLMSAAASGKYTLKGNVTLVECVSK